MRFVQFKLKSGGFQHLGVQTVPNGDIFDLNDADRSIPNNLVEFLEQGPRMIKKAETIVASGKSVVPLKNVVLLSPITKPDKLACVGLNYKGHCNETNIVYPKEPVIFSKFASCLVGPYDNVVLPKISDCIDWEVELAVVIGREGKEIPIQQVQDYIFGYSLAQDISARDFEKRPNGGQFLLNKSMDTFCPLGPAVVTKDEIKNPENLRLTTKVNGVIKQDGNTSELLFKIDYIISYLSQGMTLYPGDVILTGTPEGVGFTRTPPEFLKAGDVLESEIEEIGKLINNIV